MVPSPLPSRPRRHQLRPGLLTDAVAAVERRIAPAGPASNTSRKSPPPSSAAKATTACSGPAIYDGESGRRAVHGRLEAARRTRPQVDLRLAPIYTPAEADAWLAERQGQSPTACLWSSSTARSTPGPPPTKAIDTKIPTVVFSPVGTSFTTNTELALARSRLLHLLDRRLQPGPLRPEDAPRRRQAAGDALPRHRGQRTRRTSRCPAWASSSATSRPATSSTNTSTRR